MLAASVTRPWWCEEKEMLDERTLESGMHTWTARPETNERRPAILVLHGRNGPVEHDGCRDRAERFAQEGFVACVPDLYHRFVGDRGPIERSETRYDPTDAQSLADLDEAALPICGRCPTWTAS
jgi:dienelactone hydrolase